MSSRKTGGGVEKVYAAAQKWVDCALRADDSLFTPGTRIWTHDLLEELRERFLNQPTAGKSSFYDKLNSQLDGSPPEVYQLMGEVLYVHFLIVWHGAMRPDTKEAQINEVLQWSRSPVSVPWDLVAALSPGIAHPGTGFNTFRPYQVGCIIEFAEQWKEDPSNRDRLLTDPWDFKSFVMGVRFRSLLLKANQSTPGIQRHALLHLVHPDVFEGTVSVEQKNEIAAAKAFTHLITEPTDDVDRKLAQIRQALEASLGRDFDFYETDIRNNWAQPNAWDEYVRRARQYVDTGRLESEEIEYKREMGKDLVVARNAVLSSSSDWQDLLKYALRTRAGHPIAWQLKNDFDAWCAGHSEQALEALQILWAEEHLSEVERIQGFINILPDSALRGAAGNSTNVISVLLMALDVEQYPPFRIRLFNRAYELTGYARPEQNADEAELYEHALGFLDRLIEEAPQRGLTLRHRLDAQSVVWGMPDDGGGTEITEVDDEDDQKTPEPTEPDLQTLADSLHLPVHFLEEIHTLLEDKKQVIFQGPPGTGKTYVAQALAKHLAGSEERVTLVQFHPSYAYEDFVQGFRPTLQGGQPGFELRDGPLRRAAKKAKDDAKKDPNAKHFLVIDEINRGNIAKVFGELYFLLEYRDSEMQLQYSDEPFSLPGNLYIIGTMNTADRSIALVDLALRRRFYFMEFHPDEEPVKGVLRRWLGANGLDHMAWVADAVKRANDKPQLKQDRHAAIGPSYFMKSGLDEAVVERVWKHSVLPYIQERLFVDRDGLDEFHLDRLRPSADRGQQGEENGSGGGNGQGGVAGEVDPANMNDA